MKFKLDRTVSSAEKMSDQKSDVPYWLSRPVAERFQASMYLQSVCYKFDLTQPPRLDKTVFSKAKRG